MTKTNKKEQLGRDDLGQPHATGDQRSATSQYAVGYCRPPLETRFKKGQSGNPNGRSKGRRNVKSEIEEIAYKTVKVKDGDTTRQFTLLGANVLAHAMKGAKGDHRSSALIFNLAAKTGLLDQDDDHSASENVNSRQGPVQTANDSSPSSGLLRNLDPERLSHEEKIELSRLAEVIDLGGDVTALSSDDFKRVKQIVNKGRGKDVTPV
jgi:hypothetical protein